MTKPCWLAIATRNVSTVTMSNSAGRRWGDIEKYFHEAQVEKEGAGTLYLCM